MLNSVVSKITYDFTDGTNNRGRVRAAIDMIEQIGLVVGPAIAGILITYSIKLPILVAVILTFISFILSKNIIVNDEEKPAIKMDLNNSSFISKYYLTHLKKYFNNKFIVVITIPSICYSCIGIFLDIILSLFLIRYKGLSYKNIAFLWTLISIASILLQIPSGFLADKKKNYSFIFSSLLNIVGFYLLINIKRSLILLMLASLFVYSGSILFTTSMSALFGDLTTKENRLSESESYRMFRSMGEGIITICISSIFDKNPVLALIIIACLLVTANIIVIIINSIFNLRSANNTKHQETIGSAENKA